MGLSVGQVAALTTKSIMAEGGVRDSIMKKSAYLKRLDAKAGVYSGESLTFPFNYLDDTSTTGSFYTGAEALSNTLYDNITELSFALKEVQETLVISSADIAKNAGTAGKLKLIAEKSKIMEKAMRQRMTRAIMSDGSVSNELVGMQAFLKSSAVTYGGITNTDVATHIGYVSSNSGTNRALTTALHQASIGGASEGNVRPQIGVLRQNVLDQLIELLKPHQRTVKESLNGLGSDGNEVFYSGVSHIVDNLATANSIAFLNEDYVKLYTHPDFNFKLQEHNDGLETMDAVMHRLLWKGVYACSVLRYNGFLKDITA